MRKPRKIAPVVALGLALVAGRAAAQENGSSWYTIAIAASRNQTDQVRTLLEDKLNDPDVREGTTGLTGLDYAGTFNNVTMATVLLDHGAHVDGRDVFGNSPLHWAAEHGSLDVMHLLIDKGATIDFANKQGITPVMVAAEHAQPAAVRLLIASGADPHKQDFTGRDAFGWANNRPATVQALNSKR